MKVCPACSREYGNEHLTCPTDNVSLVAIDTGAVARGQNLIGQVVGGRYRLERVVGRGGMGTVYACRHVVVGKAFAMKVLRPGIERSEEILQRFIREAKAANSIGSRHICEVVDFGQLDDGAFYVVMELIEGVSLTRALREQRLGQAALQHVFVQMAETLQKAHERGIIHRDLKPDNVLLVEDDGDPYFAKLLDFGIAKMIQVEASNLTETGVILGTPYYMSPEQARGDPVDHRSDIYALGVMMYRAFTGRLPFMADTAMGVLTRHLTEVPEAPSRIGDVDPLTERVILRCMEKKPIDRFQSMGDVAAALRSCSAQPADGSSRATVDETSGQQLRRELDARLAAEGLLDDGTTTTTWGPSGPPSDARQTTPRFTAVATPPAGASQPAFPSPADLPSAVSQPSLPVAAPTGPSAPAVAAPNVDGAAAEPASPWPPLPAASDGSARELPVEAFTARGLVSPRIETGATRRSGPRVLLWAGAITAMMLLGGASAFVLLSPTAEPAAEGASPHGEDAGESVATDPTASSMSLPTDDESGAPPEPGAAEASSDATTPTTAADADAGATSTAQPPRPPPRPPQPTAPGTGAVPDAPSAQPTATRTRRPEIRSPFE